MPALGAVMKQGSVGGYRFCLVGSAASPCTTVAVLVQGKRLSMDMCRRELQDNEVLSDNLLL